MIQSFEHIDSVNGKIKLPGDKSISHRAVMFASMAEGKSILCNCSNSEDVHSSMSCFKQLGAEIVKEGDKLLITGKGFKNFSKSSADLYAGNSGTTARLICGILSVQSFSSVITGDESLSNRPMMRIVEPLKQMGANISASINGTLPVIINPSGIIHPIDYKLKVASAQVKSSLILAAIHLDDVTTIVETVQTRNHTEKMLGLKTEPTSDEIKIYASKGNYPKPFEMTIPSDISTASFFIVLTLLSKNSELIIKDVSLNETRTGILKVLSDMGADITVESIVLENGEPKGNLVVRSSKLGNIEIQSDIIPNIIDEIPILSVAGALADGTFKISNAKELRVKESDRIKSICSNFTKAGFNVLEYDDGFELSGSVRNEKIVFESYGDHRIAMTFAVMSMLMKSGGKVNQFECVGVSNPDFLGQIKSIC